MSILRIRLSAGAFYVSVFLITLPTPSLREIKRENPLLRVRLDLFSPLRLSFPQTLIVLRLREVWNYYVHACAMRVFMANSLLGRITFVINYFKPSNHSEDNFSKLSEHGVINISLH